MQHVCCAPARTPSCLQGASEWPEQNTQSRDTTAGFELQAGSMDSCCHYCSHQRAPNMTSLDDQILRAPGSLPATVCSAIENKLCHTLTNTSSDAADPCTHRHSCCCSKEDCCHTLKAVLLVSYASATNLSLQTGSTLRYTQLSICLLLQLGSYPTNTCGCTTRKPPPLLLQGLNSSSVLMVSME